MLITYTVTIIINRNTPFEIIPSKQWQNKINEYRNDQSKDNNDDKKTSNDCL